MPVQPPRPYTAPGGRTRQRNNPGALGGPGAIQGPYHRLLRDPWPQPSFVPQTAPGSAILDNFNVGATQFLTAPNRVGWSGGVWVSGDTAWRTDAVPTVADATSAPTVQHSCLWADRFAASQEVWLTIGTQGGAGSDIYLLCGSTGIFNFGNNLYDLRISQNGTLALQKDGTTIAAASTVQAAPAAGDSYCLQMEASYLFGWRKPSAGAWTLILSASDTAYTNAASFVGFAQLANGTSTIDNFGGGSFYSRSPHSNVLRPSGVTGSWA